jgi:hypothetical protein
MPTHTLNGVTFSRDTFITYYVAAWLASWSSQVRFTDHPYLKPHAFVQPADEALLCAEAAWEALVGFRSDAS